VSYLLAFIALGVLILVHEAGHMWVARLSGMRVDKFSIFFGPAILRWRGKKTTYQLATVPLGGYVQIAGMNPQEQLAADDTGSYQNKPAWKRFATIFAGPGINYLFAMVIMASVTLLWGLPHWQTAVAEVTKGKPAATAGMMAKDVILAIDGHRVTQTSSVLAAIGKSEGRALTFRVERDGKPLDLKIAPAKTDKGYKIGIQFGRKVKFRDITTGGALLYAVEYPFAHSKKVLSSLWSVITRKTKAQFGGPVEIVRQLKMSFEDSFVMALLFMAMLNVLLGLFNLLPLPALDGGRLIFLVVEIVTRRRVNQRVENAVHTAGFLLLIGMLLLVTYGDLKRLL
jgi:regulator of sigma E protease